MSSQTLVIALAIAATFAAGVTAASLWSALRRARSRADRAARRSDDVREAIALLGEALASTHDPRALLGVLLEATVRATGAVGGAASLRGETVASSGDPRGEPALVFRLTNPPDEARLVLYAAGGSFPSETRQLASSLVAQGRVALENVRLHRSAAEQAVTDDLTGLANRRGFSATLDLELKRAARYGTSLSLLLCDLDDFKRVNDEHGHSAGDLVLLGVADVIRSCLREIDLPARLGGEEFAVAVPEADADGARLVAERIRSAVAAAVFPIGRGVSVTVSFGVASYPQHATAEALLNAADAALYEAKRQGKDRSVVAAPG